LCLASWLVIGGVIASSGDSAFAQITPDTTLGSENSTVTSTGAVDSIDGGATRGANLFHSFQEFNVGEGRAAVFTNPSGIENILTRVTGANPSNILGTLGVSGGNANLFLINPNGIIFGPNARLDIGGSFVGSTANAIAFGNQGFFSASNPETASSLLTVNPSALFFNQIRAASIENNSVAPSGLNPSSEFIAMGLRVPDGKSLLLVGGDINMDGGGLFAFGGRVELGGLAGAGTVGLNGDGNNLSLSFPNSVERSDVSLSNGAGVRVTADDGGSIAVNARNLEMTGESELFAGIESGLGSDNSKAGNIDVNATGGINLDNRSSIRNRVLAEANGQGGDVNISASTLQVEGGARVGADTFGAGKGGNLSVDASDVRVIGTSADGRVPSGLSTSAEGNSTGDAGDLTIKTNTLLVRNGAQVGAGTFGAGKGGNLTANATDSVQLTGTSADGRFPSGLFTQAKLNTTGDAGDLLINTRQLLVRDGASVNADTFGAGKGGNLTVNAIESVRLIGTSANRRFGSSLSAQVNPNATGDGGDLQVNTRQLLVQDGSVVSVATVGAGKGGNLTINATDFVQVIGRSVDGGFGSGLSARANSNATRDAGDLTINTRQLLVRDGASVSAATFGAGKAGNLTVNATDSVQVIGESADGRFGSSLSAQANPNSIADAGDLMINTRHLLVRDGASVSANTFGAGKGGNLTVNATDSVQLIDTSANGRFPSGLFASAQRNSTGDAGNLTIKTNTLLVQDGAGVTVQSLGTGTAGNMTLNARSIRLNNNALLSANTQSARVDPAREQATININSQNLIMSRGSNIFTNATGENVIGGNINIDTDFLIAFENSDISANSTNFRGGNVRINAQGIFSTQFRDVASDRTSDITATGASPELGGTVELNIPEIDPNSGLVNLPSVPVDTEVAQACTPGGSQATSEFVVTGRGGLPQNPGEALNTDAVQVDLITPNSQVAQPSTTAVSTSTANPTPTPIVEAQGWIVAKNGEIILTANAPTVTPHSSWQKTASCRS
jgi:filamentous hemagglutinin family protein